MDTIDKIFTNHYNYYSSLGVETIKQQSAQYRQVEDAYQGRVVYELLQNAIDKAQNMIRVDLLSLDEGNYLIVANDGMRFTFGSEYNYREGNTQRYDFQSLCSIATSTKTSLKDIGNKGVGFKSVFSLNDSVEVYANGRIYPDNCDADIDFMLYNLFRTAESLSFANVDSAALLASVQSENHMWGIPGYYFPRRIERRPEFIERYFGQGFVTVVCVPVATEKMDIVKDKISSLKKYHFHFIPTKASFRNKIISLVTGGTGLTDYEFKIEWSDRVAYRPISESTISLGRKAGIEVNEDAMAAVYFHPNSSDTAHASLYNYLPTEMQSIFANIDINADFHTSVDRRHIMLDRDEPIGRYNRALLIECLRLIKDSFVDKVLLPDSVFEWPHVEFSDVQGYSDIIKEVFFDGFPSYACRVFNERMKGTDIANYDIFYEKFLFKGLDKCHIYNSSWHRELTTKAGELMRKSGVCYLPDTPCLSDNIFFRKDMVAVSMPKSIPVEFTSYSVNHWRWSDFYKAAGVKDFENTSEIYSLYWQCSSDGSYGAPDDALDEDAQIALLASVAALMVMEKDGCPDCSAWRFGTIYKDADTDSRARGAFALASLFYKTKGGRYKPGQLLRESDIDKDFLQALTNRIGKEKIEPLLRKTGVSLYKYAYADQRMTDSLKDGLDYIPPVGIKDRLSREALWRNVRIVTSSAALHPITVNQNYNFFNRLPRNDDNRKDFNALYVGNYAAMPKYYDTILSEYLRNIVTDKSRWAEISRFYNKFITPLLSHHIVIIKEGLKLKVGSERDTFYVISNESLLRDDANVSMPLLYAPMSKSNLDSILKERYRHAEIFVDEQKSTDGIFSQAEMAEDFLSDPDKQADVLVKITQSRLTDSDFEVDDIRLKYYRKFKNKQIVYHGSLSAYAVIDTDRFDIGQVPYLIQDDTIHIETGNDEDGDNARTRTNIARAFSNLVFESNKFADIFELVIFSSCYVSEEERESVKLTPVEEDLTLIPGKESGNDEADSNHPAKPDTTLPDLSKFTIMEFQENGEWKKSDFPTSNYSKSDGNGTNITPKMKKTGKKGESLMAQYFANEFMTNHPDTDAQKHAIASINMRLTEMGFQPIQIKDDDYTLENIMNALWYTKGGTKPFDIVTIHDGEVRFIEIKSTMGNKMLYFSKREIIFANNHKDSYEVYLCDLAQYTIRCLRNIVHNYPNLENSLCRIEPSGLVVTLK